MIEVSLYNNDNWPKDTRFKPTGKQSKPIHVKGNANGDVTVFPSIFEPLKPSCSSLEDVIKRIRNGHSRLIVEQVRGAVSKSERERLKKRLPAICFSGTFTQRNDNSLVNHSGFAVLDYEDVPASFKSIICKNPYVRACFVSPTGTGLKVVIKIMGEHTDTCRRLGEYFPSDGLHLQTDVSRVCFESWDSDIYYNSDSAVFKAI
ncbi:MAG TPA: BT4734/BF3469 family protein [Bacteroidales bacterium]|nr:BT4734/BF3469 family protein [Bacteroidales bacterium]